ncbi:MAG: hypothetical protein ACI4J8_05980 [Oscillospiraceae bacterium]
MKQQLKKLTAVVSAAAVVTVGGILCLSFPTKGDGIKTVLDIGQGSIVINNDTVTGKNSAGEDVTATNPNGYIITGSTTSNTVTVSGTQNIILKDATIDLTYRTYNCALDIVDSGDVALTLEG